VRSGILHALALANVILSSVASKKHSTKHSPSELQKDREIAVLRERLDLQQARMARIPPHRRPQYIPIDRMRILQLKAQEGWSLARTADEFQVTEP
jgi:hypothetical protein